MLRQNRLKILTPINGTPASQYAFRWACQMARYLKASLHAIYVIEVPLEFPLESKPEPQANEAGERILYEAQRVSGLDKRQMTARALEARNAGPAIVLEAAQQAVDLVVIGVPYQRSFATRPYGVTAEYVLKNASCQVVISREPFCPDQGESKITDERSYFELQLPFRRPGSNLD